MKKILLIFVLLFYALFLLTSCDEVYNVGCESSTSCLENSSAINEAPVPLETEKLVSATEFVDSISFSETNDTSALPPPVKPSAPHKILTAELKTYIISYKSTLISNDSVGDLWSSGVLYNSEMVYSYTAVEDTLVAGPTFTLCAVENDFKDDIGTIDITFSNLAVGEKETITKRLTVWENDGRYIGNNAVWEFVVTCSRVENGYTDFQSSNYIFEGGLCQSRNVESMPREILTSFDLMDPILLAAKITDIPDDSMIVVVWIMPNKQIQEQRFLLSSGEVLNARCNTPYICAGNASVQIILEETQELIKYIDFKILE